MRPKKKKNFHAKPQSRQVSKGQNSENIRRWPNPGVPPFHGLAAKNQESQLSNPLRLDFLGLISWFVKDFSSLCAVASLRENIFFSFVFPDFQPSTVNWLQNCNIFTLVESEKCRVMRDKLMIGIERLTAWILLAFSAIAPKGTGARMGTVPNGDNARAFPADFSSNLRKILSFSSLTTDYRLLDDSQTIVDIFVSAHR